MDEARYWHGLARANVRALMDRIQPSMFLTSATLANPTAFAEDLTGIAAGSFRDVSDRGAAKAALVATEDLPSLLTAKPAEIYRRVFRADLLVCPRCTGRMRVLAAITDPAVVGAILTHRRLRTELPAIAAARAPPQVPFWPGVLDPRPDLDAYDPA